ncbi:MAG: dihydrolipoamide acetyltransferase family protein [Actinobacteria bacterium]|nr:dihydrolipoamide acetyltransferase family protein [Actinomycetota bacterium]
MANEFRLPDIGEGLIDAEIVEWQVEVGDDVAVDQALVEIETAKAVVEITSPFAGVVLHLGGGEGDTVNVGDVLFVVGDEGEEWEPVPSSQIPVPGKNDERMEPAATSAVGTVKAMPVVRKLAQEHGVDLATLTGTGPGGAITRDDVLAATSTGPVVNDREERVQMSRMRRTIAANLTRSWQEIPHVTAQAEVDAGNLLDAHRTFKEKGPFPLEALIARAVLPLLVEFPEFNATVDGDDVILKRHYDLGFAIHTEAGLLVAVTHNSDQMTTTGLAAEIVRLATDAKDRKLKPDDVAGHTFTISNIGALGAGGGTPIIPWGTTAIVSIGRAKDSPVVRDGELAIAPVAPISLSYDHRLIDGALGQRFLAGFVANLERIDGMI